MHINNNQRNDAIKPVESPIQSLSIQDIFIQIAKIP